MVYDSSASDHSNHVGPRDLSDTAYAIKRKQLMELARSLSQMGAHTLDIDLPRMVVIGCQSAGKSSLVEAVTGIAVPREAGMCTRCPMECSLTHTTGEWACSIALSVVYDPDGIALPDPRFISFGPRLTDKAEVEIWLRRAQAALLCPFKEPKDFHGLDADAIRTILTQGDDVLTFSRNVVSIKIEEPGALELSFVDLPGLIQNDTDEAITTVRTLVQDRIKGESTIILVTMPAADDIQNQQALRLARDADPHGMRTIGVITKPDGIPPGASGAKSTWRDVISGQKFALQHGYYVVRLPDDEDRAGGITRDEAEAVAQTFFETTQPWRELIQAHRVRFGIPSFVTEMSKLLMTVIEKALPRLRADVQRLLEENAKAISRLPPARIGDAAGEVVALVTAFCSEMKEAVFGTNQDKRLVHVNRATYKAFKAAIRATAPDFRPFENHEDYLRPILNIDDHDDVSPDPLMEPMDLLAVRRVIKDSIGWELPNNVPFEAKKRLIQLSISLWTQPSRECFAKIFINLVKVVNDIATKHFARYTALQAFLSDSLREQLDSCQAAGLQAVERCLELESFPLFTQNDHYFDDGRRKWLSQLRHIHYIAYRYRRSQEGQEEEVYHAPRNIAVEDKILRNLAELGYSGLGAEDLARLHPTTRFEEELIVMADVRSYFQVAYKRIIDNIPLTIEHTLNQALVNSLSHTLIRKLDIGAEDAPSKLQRLVAEDPAVAAQRQRLQTKQSRLMEIQRKLSAFQA